MTLRQKSSLVQRVAPTDADTAMVTQTAKVVRMAADRQIVYAVVYEPNILDTWGEFMIPETVEEMAHRFMKLELDSVVDRNHDNETRDAYPIESFIARRGDNEYPEGAWVVGMKIDDADLWDEIKRGDINGFSFECMVRKRAAIVQIEYDPDQIGITRSTDDHEHIFLAHLDDDGRVISGRTSTEDGHSHTISHGTVTDIAAGHSHRFAVGD